MTATQKALVVLACALLPRAQRLRYRGEFVAELLALPRGERTAYAGALVRSAPTLRGALRAADEWPLGCRVGLHGRRRAHHPDDMRIVSKVCVRCGAVRDVSRYLTRGNAEGVAYGNVFLSAGH